MTLLRTQYFPPDRNYLDAHLTLFHALPGREVLAISQDLSDTAETTPILPARTAGVLDFGGGAAFLMEVDGLAPLHEWLRKTWQSWLTPQDDRKLKPHVTIQNKVDRETAKETQALLRDLPEMRGQAIGYDLWHYRGGPWEAAGFFPFPPEPG